MSSSAQSAAPRRSTVSVLALCGAVVAALVATWLVGADLAVRPPLPARIQSDGVTGLISLVGDLLARLSALGTLGVLTAVVMLTPAASDHTLTDHQRSLRAWSGRLGQVWFAASVLNSFANPAYVNGVPIHTTLTPQAWWTFLWASPSALAWLTSAIVALAIVLASYLSHHPGGALLSLVAGVLALVFVQVTGNVTVGLNHDWATDAAILVAIASVPLFASAVGAWLVGTPDAVTRHHRLVWPLLALAVSGHAVVAWQQLAGVSPLDTPYGLWTLELFGVLALVAVSWVVRQVTGRRTAASVLADVLLGVAYVTGLTAENHVPPPRFLEPQSIMVNYLGYEVTVAPTIQRLVSLGRPNLLWVAIVLLAVGLYLIGVWAAHRRGVRWPVVRTVSWIAAWALVLYLAVTGLWEYSTVQYSWHMVVHMTVNMMVPVLAVLGAPFALARAASDPSAVLPTPGDAVVALEDHRLWQLLTSPPVAWLAYVGGLFAVYFSPAFPWLMKYHWAHQLMLLFFMATGYFFFDIIVGSDRSGRSLPHLLKLALVISIMPFHAVFAVGILSAQALIGAPYYETIAAPWWQDLPADLMADQNIAGQATWFLGEVPLLLVIIALAFQWFRQDSTDAATKDRATDLGEDDSYDAYNEMLAELARRDRRIENEDRIRRIQP